METYRQTLDNLHPMNRKKQFSFYIFAGIVYLAIGIANYYRNNQDMLIISIWVLGGLGYIIIAFFYKNRNEKFFIEFNSTEINANVSTFTSFSIKWDEIKEIKMKPISIEFLLNSNDSKEISLGSFYYAKVIEIKSKLKEFADEKRIEIV
ncbi:MAG: hypothetical protein L3J41_09085 [Melioribacteraceae bacterium]|nr:hypothetical protein [Melioribacteraceae bacterium]